MGKKESEPGSVGVEDKTEERKQNTAPSEFIPPEGGYGWVIVFACGVANFCMLPLIQNFGLIYKDIMKRWEMTTAEYSFIVNFQFSVSNFVGLFSGPMLKKYGYRNVTLLGVILSGISSTLTSQSNKVYHFIISYSIIGGLGLGLAWSSTALAINTYFKRRRGIATGFCWTFTGLAPVITPFLITWLMGNFDVHGSVLILAAITLHNIPAALLLHPVEWHSGTKAIKGKEEEEPEEDEMKEMLNKQTNTEGTSKMPAIDEEIKSTITEKNLELRQRRLRLDSGNFLVDTQGTIGLEFSAPVSLHSSKLSLAEDYGSATAAFERFVRDALLEEVNKTQLDLPLPEPAKKSFWKRAIQRVVEFFDLGLLADKRFLMIFIGVTLAFGGEVNFTLLTPFILADKGLDIDKMALVMSILAAVDLVTRFTIPFVSDRFKLDSRLMYSVGLLILATGRIMFAHLSGFSTIIFIALWCGLGKGFRTIYMALIIPSIVPLERLPSASGLSMAANGIMFTLIGPLFGYIRDNSGDFVLPLYAINLMSLGAILVWIAEVIYTRNRKRREKLKEKKMPNILING